MKFLMRNQSVILGKLFCPVLRSEQGCLEIHLILSVSKDRHTAGILLGKLCQSITIIITEKASPYF